MDAPKDIFNTKTGSEVEVFKNDILALDPETYGIDQYEVAAQQQRAYCGSGWARCSVRDVSSEMYPSKSSAVFCACLERD